MLHRSVWRVALLLLGLWLAPALPAQAGLIPDLPGDTFGSGPVQHDILGTEINVSGGIVTVTIEFAAAIAAPSASADGVGGWIDLDTLSADGGNAPFGNVDQPGGNSYINFLVNGGLVPGPAVSGLGSEFYIDLFFEAGNPGLVDIVQTSDNSSVGTATASYVGSTLTLSFAASLIGFNGGINYAVVVGTLDEATDRAPNGDSPLQAVPEPSTLLLAGVAGIGALAYRVRRRKQS